MDTPANLSLGGPDQISLSLLDGDYTVCKLQAGSDPWTLHPTSGIRSITVTDRETSLVCTTGQEPEAPRSSPAGGQFTSTGRFHPGSPAWSPASPPPWLPPYFRFL